MKHFTIDLYKDGSLHCRNLSLTAGSRYLVLHDIFDHGITDFKMNDLVGELNSLGAALLFRPLEDKWGRGLVRSIIQIAKNFDDEANLEFDNNRQYPAYEIFDNEFLTQRETFLKQHFIDVMLNKPKQIEAVMGTNVFCAPRSLRYLHWDYLAEIALGMVITHNRFSEYMAIELWQHLFTALDSRLKKIQEKYKGRSAVISVEFKQVPFMKRVRLKTKTTEYKR